MGYLFPSRMTLLCVWWWSPQVVRLLRLVPDDRLHRGLHLLPLGLRHHLRQREDHQVAHLAHGFLRVVRASHPAHQGER